MIWDVIAPPTVKNIVQAKIGPIARYVRLALGLIAADITVARHVALLFVLNIKTNVFA
tara:strand:- start:1406 stop:1579 length:174 start_codon:yes stop_codon:yes gene_type:complete